MKRLYTFTVNSLLLPFVLLFSPVLCWADVDYFTVTAKESNVDVKILVRNNSYSGSYTTHYLEYSTDNGENWNTLTLLTKGNTYTVTTLANIGDKVMFRGDNPNGLGNVVSNGAMYLRFMFEKSSTKKTVSLSGNIMTLIDKEGTTTTTPGTYTFYRLFEEAKVDDVSGLSLPATTLSNGCYSGMFYKCTSLTSVMETLPATTLAVKCYEQMFALCSALTTSPSLLATSLAASCYYNMFGGCSKLTTAPELPATTLAESCYKYMFGECYALTTAPDLPATTLAKECYYQMFSKCTTLVNVPEKLPAIELPLGCYGLMFSNCSTLVNAPEIMAKTINYSSSESYGCMYKMFASCPALRKVKVHFTEWSDKTVNDKYPTNLWLDGTYTNAACKFICPCELSDTPRNTSHIQTNWTRSTINTYVFDVATNGGTWDGSDYEEMTHERISNDASTNIVTLPTAQKSGYVFMGWNTADDGSGTTLTIDNQTDYTCSNTFYAQFAPQYTFCVNGGSWDGSDTDNRVLTNPVVSVSDPILDGFTFLGWNTAVDGSGEAWDIDHQPATPQTYYAQWEEIVPTILELDDNVDNTALLTENTGNTLAVRLVGRTLVGGTTNTLCLPFSMTAEQLDDSPLAGSTIWTFDRATATEEMLTVEMTPADAITAGVPYLIEPLTNIVEPVFEGVTISAVNGSKTGDSDVRFVGVMIPTLLEAGNKNQLFLTAGNMLQTPSVSNYMRGYRAYFLLNDAASMPARARVAFHRDRPMPTDIKDTDKGDTQVKKMMIDGVMYIKRGNTLYNISGTEVPLH